MTPKQKQMLAAWVAVIGSLGVMDWALNEREDGLTASESTRAAIAATPGGPALFTVGWAYFSTWFWRHILFPKHGK